MRKPKITPNTKLISWAKPRLLPGGEECILLIHGWTGTPRDLEAIGNFLNQKGYTVAIPRLPGHGTTLDDMESASAEIWLRHVVDYYQELREEYREVYVGGESMGGLLALLLGAFFPVSKIVLFAPALATKSRQVYLTPFIKYLIKRRAVPVTIREEDDEETIYYKKEYKGVNSLSTIAELVKLIHLTRKNLKKIHSSLLVFWSEDDDSVSKGALKILDQKTKEISIEKVVLKESGHLVTNGPEKEIVQKKVLEFLRK